MRYTKEDKLYLTLDELSNLLKCSFSYIDTAMGSYRLAKYMKKIRRNKPFYIDFNEDFLKDFREYVENKSSRRTKVNNNILKILETIEL